MSAISGEEGDGGRGRGFGEWERWWRGIAGSSLELAVRGGELERGDSGWSIERPRSQAGGERVKNGCEGFFEELIEYRDVADVEFREK